MFGLFGSDLESKKREIRTNPTRTHLVGLDNIFGQIQTKPARTQP